LQSVRNCVSSVVSEYIDVSDVSDPVAGGGLRGWSFSAMPTYATSARITGGATPVVANTMLRNPDFTVSLAISLRYFRMRFSDPPLFPHGDSNPESLGPHPLSSDTSWLHLLVTPVIKTFRPLVS